MTDLLFSTEPTPPTELQAARARYTQAQKACDECPTEKVDDAFWLSVGLTSAKSELRAAEARELERLKQ